VNDEDFLCFALEVQIVILDEFGIFLISFNHGKRIYSLFKFLDCYVEVVYDGDNKGNKVSIVHDDNSLDKYLANLDISEIVDLL